MIYAARLGLLLLLEARPGLQFGTVDSLILGQHTEHERITRAALACQDAKTPDCFEPKSIDQLAGADGTFGAVGDPDKPRSINPFSSQFVEGSFAHCDDADFLALASYPQSRGAATAMLQGCVSHLTLRATEGVTAAEDILTDKNLIKKDQVSLGSCEFQDDPDDHAKCKALQGFGRALHGVQDFYSHSNWADRSGPGVLDALNPPGLYRPDAPGFLDLRSPAALTIAESGPFFNLSTGCYGGTLQDKSPGVGVCLNRITHKTINKDEGIIDPASGATSNPDTPRGQISTNFNDAVQGAIIDTRRQWRHFRYSLQQAYGSLRANRIACAMTTDDPVNDCQGRKVAIVIDSSGSNTDTDPSNLRIAAGIAMNDALISADEAGPDGKADLVTVIDFDDTATVTYPLGDPANAAAAFASIDSSGGTYIAGGLSAAIDEIDAETTVPTRSKSAIIILTDGQDSSIVALIAQLLRARLLGIRVSFGFLSPLPIPIKRGLNRRQSTSQDPDLLQAIIETGGTYSVITSAEAQQAFIDLVITRGATQLDDNLGLSTLRPSLTIADTISSSNGSEYFLYEAAAGQSLNFTIRVIDPTPDRVLTASLHDIQRNVDIVTQISTDSTGLASIVVDTACDRSLELTITANPSATDAFLFSVELQTTNATLVNDTASCELIRAPPAPVNPPREIASNATTNTTTSSATSTTTTLATSSSSSSSSSSHNSTTTTTSPTSSSTSMSTPTTTTSSQTSASPATNPSACAGPKCVYNHGGQPWSDSSAPQDGSGPTRPHGGGPWSFAGRCASNQRPSARSFCWAGRWWG